MDRTDNIYSKLQQLPLFMGMTQETVLQIAGKTKLDFTTIEAKQTIVKESEPCKRLWFIFEGEASTTTFADDHSYKITEYINAPCVLQPEYIFGLHQHFTQTVQAETNCKALSISKKDVLKLLVEYDIFRINLLNIIATKSQKLWRQLWHKHPRTLEQHLINFLITHCLHPVGRKVFNIKMARLAEELNDNRLNVSRILRMIEKQNLIELHREEISIPHMEELIKHYKDIMNEEDKKRISEQQLSNPFFKPYNTLHNTIPFKAIKVKHYEEAFMEGIRRDDEETDKIINDPAEPTFDNTIVREDNEKGEDYYDLLENVSTVFSAVMEAETNNKIDQLAQKLTPILAKHDNDVMLNKRLFERVKCVYDKYHSTPLDPTLKPLSSEQMMLLENCYDGFVRSGALLDEDGKAQLRKLTEEASTLSLMFSQNLLKENKAFKLHITDEKLLEGIPETAKEIAAMTAKERKKSGWIFTLDAPSYSPFMTYCRERELRKKLYMAKNTEGIHNNNSNNIKICQRLINIRRELAQLLGYDTYADYVMKHRMATNVDNVYKLLYQLIDAYKPTAIEEVKAIEDIAKRTEGDDFELMPWDFSYYSHKLQMEKYDIDSEMLRPYFQLSKVIDGVFGLANKLYGITFKENKEIQVYHPDVKAYEVFDRDGGYLAVFYADFHPRKGKRGGAWMTEFQGQWITKKGKNVRPHVSVVMNLTKPTDEKPSLLTLGEVETFLHEFGHSLHGMFANTHYESLSGTNVWWDFVELPSQFMENYATEKDFLRTFAFHYQTGEPLPDELIDRIVKSRNFMAAYGCLRQVSFSLLDMAYYTKKDEFKDDIIKFEKEAWADAMVTQQLPDTCMTTQFSHIMAGGYAAGYYSYKWAEVLDADAFSVFKKNGIFDQTTAQRFRDEILSKGGTEHPMTLYKRFRGQEPTIDALLERNGIKK